MFKIFNKSLVNNDVIFDLFTSDVVHYKITYLDERFKFYNEFKEENYRNPKFIMNLEIETINSLILGTNHIKMEMENINKKLLKILIDDCENYIIRLHDLKMKWKKKLKEKENSWKLNRGHKSSI